MPVAWKVIVRDKAGNVVRTRDGKEMKLLVGGKSTELPDGTRVPAPCPFQTEADVCDHVRRHFPNYVPIGAYDADRDQPAMLFPVPPQAFQHGILDAVERELGGSSPFDDAGLPRALPVNRQLLPRTPLPRKPLRR